MVLHNSIPRCKIEKMCLCLHKSTCKPESPSPTYNWHHHTDWMKHCIPAQNSETTSLLPLNFPVVKTRLTLFSQLTNIDLELDPQAKRWVQALLLMGHQN